MRGRGVLAIAILAAWGAGLAALAQREVSRSASDRLAEAAMRISPVASYYAIGDGGAHVGFASFATDTVPDGLQFTEYSVRDGGAEGRRARQVVAQSSRALILRQVVVSAGAPVATARVTDDSTLVVVREGVSGADTTRATFRAPLLLPSLVPAAIALGRPPEAGDRHAWDVFDPTTLRVRRVAVTVRAESTWVVLDSAAFDAGARRWRGVRGDTVTAWHVVEDGEGATGQRVDAWVDEQGLVVATHAAIGELRRAAYELAFENWRSTDRAGTTPSATAPAPITGVRDAPRLAELTLLATGLHLTRLDAATEWQVVRGDTLLAVAPTPTGRPNGYWLPPARDFRGLHVRDLQVEPGIEVESPLVVATTRRLRGKEPDPMAFARALARWVSDSIRLEPTLTPPSALTTLRSRAGDVDHHTVTFLALARAAGVPARAVRGVLRTADAWRSHAWAEVFVGGTWLPVDPSTGAVPVDAAHVRLKVGPVGIAPELDRLVERASLRALASTPAPRSRGGLRSAPSTQP